MWINLWKIITIGKIFGKPKRNYISSPVEYHETCILLELSPISPRSLTIMKCLKQFFNRRSDGKLWINIEKYLLLVKYLRSYKEITFHLLSNVTSLQTVWVSSLSSGAASVCDLVPMSGSPTVSGPGPGLTQQQPLTSCLASTHTRPGKMELC